MRARTRLIASRMRCDEVHRQALAIHSMPSTPNATPSFVPTAASAPLFTPLPSMTPSSPPKPSPSKTELKDRLKELEDELNRVRLERGSETPPHMRCPITLQRLSDPVVCADGHAFERRAITQWLRHNLTNPLTGAELPNRVLIPSIGLRDAVREWEAQHGREPAVAPTIASPPAAGPPSPPDSNEEEDDGGDGIDEVQPSANELRVQRATAAIQIAIRRARGPPLLSEVDLLPPAAGAAQAEAETRDGPPSEMEVLGAVHELADLAVGSGLPQGESEAEQALVVAAVNAIATELPPIGDGGQITLDQARDIAALAVERGRERAVAVIAARELEALAAALQAAVTAGREAGVARLEAAVEHAADSAVAPALQAATGPPVELVAVLAAGTAARTAFAEFMGGQITLDQARDIAALAVERAQEHFDSLTAAREASPQAAELEMAAAALEAAAGRRRHQAAATTAVAEAAAREAAALADVAAAQAALVQSVQQLADVADPDDLEAATRAATAAVGVQEGRGGALGELSELSVSLQRLMSGPPTPQDMEDAVVELRGGPGEFTASLMATSMQRLMAGPLAPTPQAVAEANERLLRVGAALDAGEAYPVGASEDGADETANEEYDARMQDVREAGPPPRSQFVSAMTTPWTTRPRARDGRS